ncbi:MAG: ABC transporter ATP-binding protein [Campylobacter sp.]|nr:ABC transporter ATP-binding protein [Campylobacter sp.]
MNYSSKDRDLALDALKTMGISHLKDYTMISGDERQLAYIVRVLVQKARIIFMDGSTNGLDFGNQIKLLLMIKNLQNKDYTLIQTTHHPKHAKFISNRAMLIKDGEILAFDEVQNAINSKNISEIYSVDYERYKDKF